MNINVLGKLYGDFVNKTHGFGLKGGGVTIIGHMCWVGLCFFPSLFQAACLGSMSEYQQVFPMNAQFLEDKKAWVCTLQEQEKGP